MRGITRCMSNYFARTKQTSARKCEWKSKNTRVLEHRLTKLKVLEWRSRCVVHITMFSMAKNGSLKQTYFVKTKVKRNRHKTDEWGIHIMNLFLFPHARNHESTQAHWGEHKRSEYYSKGRKNAHIRRAMLCFRGSEVENFSFILHDLGLLKFVSSNFLGPVIFQEYMFIDIK